MVDVKVRAGWAILCVRMGDIVCADGRYCACGKAQRLVRGTAANLTYMPQIRRYSSRNRGFFIL